MISLRLALLLAATLALLLQLNSCSGSANGDSPDWHPLPSAGLSQLPALPSASGHGPIRESSELYVLQTADKNFDYLESSATFDGSSLDFIPGNNKLGWMISRFPGSASDIPLSVSYYGQNLFPGSSVIHLAIANYDQNRWQIISSAALESNTVTLGGNPADYLSPDGSLYLAVLIYDCSFQVDALEVLYQNRSGPASSWPVLGSGPAHSFRGSASSVSMANPEWRVDGLSYLFGSGVTIGGDGALYFCGLQPDDHGRIYCLNPDGTERWSHQLLDRAMASPAVDADGHVYVGNRAREIRCFTGPENWLWYYDADGEVDSSPVFDASGNIISASVQGKKVFAINRSGTELWSYPGTAGFYSSAAIDTEGNIYCADVLGKLHSMTSNGSPRWIHAGTGACYGAVVLDESAGRAYYGTDTGWVYAVALEDGNGVNANNYGGQFLQSPALAADGSLFVCNSDGKIYHLGSDTALIESFDSGAPFNSTPVIDAAGNIFCANSAGRLLCLNSELDIVWELELESEVRAPLTLGTQGELYVPTMGGSLWCFAPSKTVPSKPTGLSATDASFSAKIELSWDEQLDANGLNVFRDDNVTPIATVGYVTSYVDESVPDSNPHTYWIQAVNELGSSALSDPDDGTLKVTVAGAGEWDQFGGDPAHTCRVSVSGPHSKNIAWTYTLPGSCYTCPVIGIEGEVYVATTDTSDDQAYVTCLNPDMSFRWEFVLPQGEYPRFSLAIAADGTLYVPTDLRLLSLDSDGEEGWSFVGSEGSRGFFGIAIDDAGLIYATSNSPSNGKWTFCLNSAGEEQWKVHKASVNCVPAIGSNGWMFITDDSYAIRSYLPNGVEGLVYGITESVEHSVTLKLDEVNGDTLYCTGNGLLFSYDVDTNAENWRYPDMGADFLYGVAALAPDNNVLTGGSEGIFKILADGSLGWHNTDMASLPANQCMIVDAEGYAYMGDFNDKFYCVSPSGSLQWSDQLGGTRYSSPAIGPEGNVYIATENGLLRCYTVPAP